MTASVCWPAEMRGCFAAGKSGEGMTPLGSESGEQPKNEIANADSNSTSCAGSGIGPDVWDSICPRWECKNYFSVQACWRDVSRRRDDGNAFSLLEHLADNPVWIVTHLYVGRYALFGNSCGDH